MCADLDCAKGPTILYTTMIFPRLKENEHEISFEIFLRVCYLEMVQILSVNKRYHGIKGGENMQEEEMLVYVREVNRKCQKRMESRENLVLDIEENIARNSRQRILVVLDQIKSLGRFKDVWPASEKSNPFEKRCAMAKARQHFHGGNIEMFYMFQGSGKNYIGDQEYEIHQGDLWLLGKSVYHGIALNDDAIIMNVLFEPEITSDLYEDPACQ